MIDFQQETPRWIAQAPLVQPASLNNALALPNGEVLVVGGTVGRGPWDNTLVLQMFDPKTGLVRSVLDIFVPHHDHSTVALLPDGRVAIMGGNATDLSGLEDHVEDAIPVVQVYEPPYLFRGPRPEMKNVQTNIEYGQRFQIEVDDTDRISSVMLIRPGPVTHNWDWGNRSVKLWFERTSKTRLRVQAPAAPGLAVPGYYMLFVVTEDGVPAEARRVHVHAECTGVDCEQY